MEYEYTLKVSNRAKRVNLKVTAEDGLVVTVPKRYNQKKIPEVLARHKSWLNKMHIKFKDEREKRLSEPVLPKKIYLKATNEQWHVFYKKTDITTVRIKQKENVIILYGAIDNQDLCLKKLHNWLKEKARLLFIPILEEYSKSMATSYNSLRLGNQKSRWGSCSSKKSISLNMKLLFLPEYLMRYVIIHELSHLTHMNHSHKFWAYVNKFEPNYKEFDKELRNSWGSLPRFVI